MTDYSLHSIGVLLFRRKQHDIFRQFINDMVMEAGIIIISILAEDIEGCTPHITFQTRENDG